MKGLDVNRIGRRSKFLMIKWYPIFEVNNLYSIETHNAVLDTSTDIFRDKDENADIAIATARLSDAEYEDIK